MRLAFICVFFRLIIHKDGSTVRGDDFRPTPIPLDEWHPTKGTEQKGTLHEIIKTESPPAVAALPAHYWEDALRHSVYLTLVRDKIDQLIAQGDVIAPNSKLDQPVSTEIDDHDLWEKIKKAPFDRRPSELNSLGDVAIMAKGRLLGNESGFRFTEDDRSQDNCSDDRCAEGVKAFWSVKRVRQRDIEMSPGKYHYELTFSVVSQIPKKQRKPYENPIRTFTVRETERTVDYPQEHRKLETFHFQTARPQRAIWFHKNIVPIPPHTSRQPYRGLDRIFSSLFSDEDDTSYDQPQPKYRSNSGSPQAYQFSKIGHAGPTIDYHQQTKPIPYTYKQSQPYKYIRTPLQAPPAGPLQHHYLDYDSSPIINGNPLPSHDSRISPNQAVKTTRPAVLPTPVPIISPQKEQTFDLGIPMLIDSSESSENITRYEINNSYKNPIKLKPTPPKVNFFPEHNIRPPVYNAPPGVFVTMDKKPFKPMPPLKHVHNSKPHRVNKPVDFRPSPQVHDSQSPNSDPLFDTAFRPITVNYAESSTTKITESIQAKKINYKQRKPNSNSKKPTKKHQNVKTIRLTTETPDIITAQSLPDDDEDTMDWANVLGAFTKTTPMVLQTEKQTPVETTTSFSIKNTTNSIWKKPTIISEAPSETTTPITTTTTTLRPKKRTRPPPKFTKQDKIMKHKRITTSTTEITQLVDKSTMTTDVTPLASSTTRGVVKSIWDSKNKTRATTSTTTTSTTPPTTTKIISTTTKQASTTPYTTTTFASRQTPTSGKPDPKLYTTNPTRSKNRFRQSTLFYKGTSVKHDKWSVRNYSTSQSQNFRRTSNFQGYVTSTTPVTTQNNKDSTQSSNNDINTSSTTEKIVFNKSAEESVLPLEKTEENETENSQEAEYIFEHSTVASSTSNELMSLDSTTIKSIPSQFESSKNKTKCKNKKIKTTTTEAPSESYPEQSTPKTTEDSTDDIFDQLFGFNFNSETSTTKDTSKIELLEEGSSHHASFLKADDDLTDFMTEFNKKQKQSDSTTEDDYEDDDEEDDEDDDDDDESNSDDQLTDDEEDAQIEDEDDKESSRDSRYESYNLGRPYSLLELMAME